MSKADGMKDSKPTLQDYGKMDFGPGQDTSMQPTGDMAQASQDKNILLEPGMVEDRFRVDRRKLEQMLQATNGQTETAAFFQRIMDETGVHISWPSKLKIGAKSKKDPHIKIIGHPEALETAREQILEVLDTKRNRVTLKMDVSFVDHSHVIGKGGHSIQKVMEETGCHIHFPDSNRNSNSEKSNQVSIAGQPTGVEQARCLIREMLPLVLTFEFPVTGCLQPMPDPTSPAIYLIQQTYGFTVTFRQKSRDGPTLVVVRGCQSGLPRFKQGLGVLMDYFTGSSGSSLPVTVTIEIPPQHHAFVIGHGGINMQLIMRQTRATVSFPDGSPVASVYPYAVQPQQKSSVSISGQFENVFMAWQELMGCLPLVLMFDLKEDQELASGDIRKLVEQHNINILVKPKPKQNSKTIVVRGAERDSKVLFEIRSKLLNLELPEIPVCCEKHSRHSKSLLSSLLLSSYLLGGLSKLDDGTKEFDGFQPLISSKRNVSDPMGAINMCMQQYPGLLDSQNVPVSNSASPWNLPFALNDSNLLPLLLNQLTANNAQTNMAGNHGNWIDLPAAGFDTASTDRGSYGSQASSSSSRSSSPMETYSDYSDYYRSRYDLYNQDKLLHSNVSNGQNEWGRSILNTIDKNSNSNGKSGDLDKIFPKDRSTNGLPSLNSSVSTRSLNDLVADYNHANEIRPRMITNAKGDYDSKKLLATEAMRKPVGSELRKATDVWAGFGFSRSMPQSVIRDKLIENGVLRPTLPKVSETEKLSFSAESLDNSWKSGQASSSSVDSGLDMDKDIPVTKESLFSASNYFESILPHKNYSPDIPKDLPHLLVSAGLGKYVDMFQHHEIDLPTFMTMADADFQEMGIPYGARRKMMLCISELVNRQMRSQDGHKFQAAPGAERRSSYISKNQFASIDNACW